MLLSDFHFKENDGFQVVPVHPGFATSDNGVHEVGVTVCVVQHVLGVCVHMCKSIKFIGYGSRKLNVTFKRIFIISKVC